MDTIVAEWVPSLRAQDDKIAIWTGFTLYSYYNTLLRTTPETGSSVIVLETDVDHPFVQHELMMPILPVVRVKDVEEGIKLSVECEHGFRHTAMCHSKNIDVLTEFARRIQTTIFVKNAPSYAGIGFQGEGYTTFTIAGPTGEGLTSARSFTRKRRCVLAESFNIK